MISETYMQEKNSFSQPIRIFIGSSLRNFVEERVFVYSLTKYSKQPIEINIIDGETGSVTLHTGEVRELPFNISNQISGATAFSLARYAIPKWCDYQGKAIYCDSDQIVLTDILELWSYDLSDSSASAVPVKSSKSSKHYVDNFLEKLKNCDDQYYLTSVMIIDCSKLKHWDINKIVKDLEEKKFSYTELMFLGSSFRNRFTSVKALPSEWNHLDILLEDSKLLHFTDLTSQPWLFHHNKTGYLWEQYFLEAVEQGFITKEELEKAFKKGFISKRVRDFPFINKKIRPLISKLWRTWNLSNFLVLQGFQQQIHLSKNNIKKYLRSLVLFKYQ